MNTGLRAFSKY